MEAPYRKTLTDANIIVFIGPGTYFLTESIKIDATSSGSAQQSVTFSNLPGQAGPIVSGGEELLASGWVGPDSSNVYRYELEGKDSFRQLYAGERKLTRARQPDVLPWQGDQAPTLSWLENEYHQISFANLDTNGLPLLTNAMNVGFPGTTVYLSPNAYEYVAGRAFYVVSGNMFDDTTPADNVTISDNTISNALNMLTDAGAINTGGSGMRITNNSIEAVWNRGWNNGAGTVQALYLDIGSYRMTAAGNDIDDVQVGIRFNCQGNNQYYANTLGTTHLQRVAVTFAGATTVAPEIPSVSPLSNPSCGNTPKSSRVEIEIVSGASVPVKLSPLNCTFGANQRTNRENWSTGILNPRGNGDCAKWYVRGSRRQGP